MPISAIFSEYQKTKNEKQFLKSLKDFLGVAIHKTVEPYLIGEENLEGSFFKIKPFEKCHQNLFTYQKLFKRFDNTYFPAVLIGGDSYGVELWLVLTNGKVISLHHDASFYEVASDINATDTESFVEKFSSLGSIFTISTLAEFQKKSSHLDKKETHFERKLLKITAESLGWSIAQLAKSINKLALESIYSLSRDFIEDSGFDDLIAAEKKIAQIEKNKTTKLDLSICFLEKLPDSLLTQKQLHSLNLSGNPISIQKELLQLPLKQLDISDCQLVSLPALPESLEELIAGNNALKNLKGIDTCKNLKNLDIRKNAIEESEIEAFRKKNPNCNIIYQEKATNIDQELLDLSNQNIKKLPK